MSIIVTGAAGFIGSCIVRTLNDIGETDIIAVDDIASTEKWRNLCGKKYKEYVHKSRFLVKLPELDRGGYKLLFIWVLALPRRSGILIIFTPIILSIPKNYGTIVRNRISPLSMPALLRPMVMARRGSVTRWTLIDCVHSTATVTLSNCLICG